MYRKSIRAALPPWMVETVRDLKFKFGFKAGTVSWSQEGEDLVLRKIFGGQRGFYVDVGAHHPYRYSNTYALHQAGWRGLNIDALAEAIRLFDRARPGDINVHVGVTRFGGAIDYFRFNDPAYNTFDRAVADEVVRLGGHAILDRVERVNTMPLSAVLDQHLPQGQKIDLMNVDVEGLDLEVLQSNDWNKYRPLVLVAEERGSSIISLMEGELYRCLVEQGYVLISKFANSAIFKVRA